MSPYRNPEFRRQVWLELTPQRLVVTPLILGLILLLVWFAKQRLDALSTFSMMLFVGMTVLWGAKLAADSLNNELVQGTWDSQRLSGMGAWQMTIGKLAGGPVFAWYGGVLCLGAFALTTPWDWPALRMLIGGLAAAVAIHSLALLSALLAWRKFPRTTTTPRARGTWIILVLMAPQLFFGLSRSGQLGDVSWYGWTFPAADFTLACGLLTMAWALFGLYRVMREELAFRDPPNAWIAFLLFLFAFVGGWFHGGGSEFRVFRELDPTAAHLAACIAMSLAANYFLLFGERKDWLRMRRLVALWRDHQRRRAWELTPKWLATFGITSLTTIVFCLTCLVTEPPMRGIAAGCTALAFVAFLVRDGAIVLGLNFARDQTRADAAAGIYLVVLYALLPGLLGALGLQALATMFWPPRVFEQPVWLVLIVLETAGALDFAVRRWRRLPA